MESWRRFEVKLLDSSMGEDGYHKAGHFHKQEHQETLSCQKIRHDKYFKETIEPYVDLVL